MPSAALLLLLAAPLPFPHPLCGTYETPGGCVLKLEAGGRAFYGRGLPPEKSRPDYRWREAGAGVVVSRDGEASRWFARRDLRRLR